MSDGQARVARKLTMRPARFARPAMILAAIALLVTGGVAYATKSQARCSAPEYRQFDFFAGDWDTYDVTDPNTIVARNHVTPMVGGCALREVYEQTDGMRGESFSTYDASRQLWHQSWVTNRGTLLLLDGGLVDGRMVLTATEHGEGGKSSLLRGVWWVKGKSVRERAERSKDGGATWAPVFDIVFWPHGFRDRGR